MDRRTFEYYERNATSIAERYETVESPFEALFPIIFKRGDRVLDIGSGSGRDVALMMKYEMDGHGLDASPALLEQAALKHPELRGRLYHGVLPCNMPEDLCSSFDGVLLSAVLMHLPESDLFDAAIGIRRLLKTGGTLLVSIPTERNDISDEPDRDDKGRLMVLRPVPMVQLLFERIGFEAVSTWHSGDKFARQGVRWVSLQFVYHGAARSRTIDQIESIINRDSKVATYKLALLRALCDIAQHESGIVSWNSDGQVGVPIGAIADKWIEYYWPLMESMAFVPQIGGESPASKKPVVFRRALGGLIDSYRGNGGLTGYVVERGADSITPESLPFHQAALSKVKQAIQKPVFFAGGGDAENKPFIYNRADRRVYMEGDLWREFTLLGHLVRDSIILRWSEETSRISKGNIKSSTAFDLLLSSAVPVRDVSLAKDVFGTISPLHCVWSGNSIRKFDIDHAIPFSLWRDNSLWTLFPSTPAINNRKRDKLPELELLVKRKDLLIHYWDKLRDAHTTRFLRDTGKIAKIDPSKKANWEEPLFNGFLEAVETTAIRRGVERWAI